MERQGYSSTVATDAKAALDLFVGSPDDFDLLITDQVMPGLTGLALAARIHGHKPGLPIILLTGIADSVVSRLQLSSGPMVVLQKPTEPQELWDAIRRLSQDEFGDVH